MALFKINRGNSSNLPGEKHDGWAYFCTDTGEFFIDYNDNNTIKRKRLTNTYYGECVTAAATAAKVVTIPGFTETSLMPGVSVTIKFNYANSVANPSLNISGTGAKPIYQYGHGYDKPYGESGRTKVTSGAAVSTGTTTTGWRAGAIINLTYDGECWVRDYWTNSTYSNASLGQGHGTCTTAASTVAKTVSISSYSLSTGGIIAVHFANGNTASNPTLNVSSKGAKPIWYKDAALTNTKLIEVNDIVTMMYTGSAYCILNVYKHTTSGAQGKNVITSTATSNTNAAKTSNGVYLNHVEGVNIIASSNLIIGDTATGNVSVTSDNDGTMTIHAPVDAAINGESTNPVQNKIISAALDTKLSKITNDTLNDGITTTWTQYNSTRSLTISGNSITADMSNVTGGWAGAFATVIDPAQDATTMLGWYGDNSGLSHIYMGGAYSDPFMKMTKSGQFTFKYTPDVSGDPLVTKTTFDNGQALKVNKAGDSMTGHLYLAGAKESSSTSNTSQIVFGTPENNHVAISSNTDAIVINPDTNTSSPQIVLYIKQKSKFPYGLESGSASTNSFANTSPLSNNTYTLGTSSLKWKEVWATTFQGNATSADKVNASLAIKINNGTAENTNLWTYNGSTAKTIDLTLGKFGITATANELNILDGATVTVTEVNYLKGVTSAIQAQLNSAKTTVTQNAAITTAGAYPILLGYNTAMTAVTNTVNKASTLNYNPNTQNLATGSITIGSGVTLSYDSTNKCLNFTFA